MQSLLNDILQKLVVTEMIIPDLCASIRAKIKDLKISYTDQSQNFKAIKIILSKFGKEKCEEFLDKK